MILAAHQGGSGGQGAHWAVPALRFCHTSELQIQKNKTKQAGFAAPHSNWVGVGLWLGWGKYLVPDNKFKSFFWLAKTLAIGRVVGGCYG